MKNNSVKFKRNIPKSSTTSVISEFSLDHSPMPNAIQFAAFSHSQSISARLTKNSVYNTQNMIFNTPRCLNVPMNEIMKDNVLAKSPLSRMSQTYKEQLGARKVEPVTFTDAVNIELKYTDLTLKKIKRLERFLEHQKQKQFKGVNILSSEETPKRSENFYQQIEQAQQIDQIETKIDAKVNKKFNSLMEELRILRKNIQYFTAFDGAFATREFEYYNYVPLKSGNGLIVNNGRHLTKLQLMGDTFKIDQICDNCEPNSKIITYCVTDPNINSDMILAGTDKGSILGWNFYKNEICEYYGLNQDIYGQLNQQPTFIMQHLQNIYVGTQNNQLLILDPRLQEKNCLTFSKTKQQLFRADSVQQSPLINRMNSYNLESPQTQTRDVNDFLETNFKLDDQMEIEEQEQEIKLEIPQFKQIEKKGVKYIDVNDYNVIATMPNGFIHFDIRAPLQEQFSHLTEGDQSIRAQFTPNSQDNIIYSQENSNKCLVWNVQKNELLFEKDLQSCPKDVIISPITKEILTLHDDGMNSIIKIFNNQQSKMKYVDDIVVNNFDVRKLLLDSRCECLYGIGSYSLRTWNYFNSKEIDMIQKEMQHQLEILF